MTQTTQPLKSEISELLSGIRLIQLFADQHCFSIFDKHPHFLPNIKMIKQRANDPKRRRRTIFEQESGNVIYYG